VVISTLLCVAAENLETWELHWAKRSTRCQHWI